MIIKKKQAILVYQGENKYVKDNYYIGGFEINFLKKALAGAVNVNISMELDDDGILKVKAEEQDSNNKKEFIIQDILNLTKEQIEIFKEIENHFQHKKHLNTKLIKLKNKIKEYIYYQNDIIQKYPKKKQNIILQNIEKIKNRLENNNITEYEINEIYKNLKNVFK